MALEFLLGDLSGLAEGEMRSCSTGSIDVLVCRVGGDLFAIEDMCSHADTILSDGQLSGYTVICALHGAQFDVRDGTHQGPPAFCGVGSFDVHEDADGVSVTLRKSAETEEAPQSGFFQTR